MRCDDLLSTQCSNGHIQKWKCHQGAPFTCRSCEAEDEARKRKKEAAYKLQQDREAAAQAHIKNVEELDAQIEAAKQQLANGRLAREREAVLEQKRRDLQNAIAAAAPKPHPSSFNFENYARTEDYGDLPESDTSSETDNSSPKLDFSESRKDIRGRKATEKESSVANNDTDESSTKLRPTESRKEWLRQKEIENASNEAIDEIMDLVGLEDVCAQVLSIKDKIEISQRQNLDMKRERFSIIFQGNPGTGEARIPCDDPIY